MKKQSNSDVTQTTNQKSQPGNFKQFKFTEFSQNKSIELEEEFDEQFESQSLENFEELEIFIYPVDFPQQTNKTRKIVQLMYEEIY